LNLTFIWRFLLRAFELVHTLYVGKKKLSRYVEILGDTTRKKIIRSSKQALGISAPPLKPMKFRFQKKLSSSGVYIP